SAARHTGRVALPGAGLDCAVGDLAAAWAAAELVGAADAGSGEPVRSAAAVRLAEDYPLDDVAVSYVVSDLALSAGGQRSLFGALGSRALVWWHDRWEPGDGGAHRVDAGALGVRDAFPYAGGDPIAIPFHVAARQVASYVSTTRNDRAAAALRIGLR